jgi:membrane protein YdbS with pleckstrin-like domain
METGGLIPLDRRVIQLWRLTSLLGFAIFAIPALVGLLIASNAVFAHAIIGFVPWAVLLLLAGFWVFWYPPRAYRAFGYRVEERVIEIRSGVWFRVVRFLPLSRLQHVDLRRGPLERAHGLASLTLHTAGTHEASLLIPGLANADAERLRDQLITVGGDDAV